MFGENRQLIFQELVTSEPKARNCFAKVDAFRVCCVSAKDLSESKGYNRYNVVQFEWYRGSSRLKAICFETVFLFWR